MRINARLDDEGGRQVEYLTQTTGQSVSHVVREAVALYYEQTRSVQPQPQPQPLRLLAAVGRGGSGRSDVASHYKALFGEGVAAKYGLGPT